MPISRSLERTIESLAPISATACASVRVFSARAMEPPPAFRGDGIPSEKLTALEQVCHVLDVELEGYRVRFERTRTESMPDLPDLPGEQMATERNYAGSDPAIVLPRFASARAGTVEALRRLTPHEFGRVAIFEGKADPRSLVSYIFLSSHDYQHLSGLQWLMGEVRVREANLNFE